MFGNRYKEEIEKLQKELEGLKKEKDYLENQVMELKKIKEDNLKETETFINIYPNSKYLYLVKTIQARLYMAKASFDKEIAELYNRINKPKAFKIYNKKAKNSWKDIKNIQSINVPWYRAIFE